MDAPPRERSFRPIVPAGFFAFRTPLLPLEALVEWGEALAAPSSMGEPLEEALARDRQVLRERLRKWVADPVIREALFLASPVLEESLPVWLEEPDCERGQKVERSLVRYFARMAGRSTPFGLFASTSTGHLGELTRLRISERSGLRRHTRLDMDYVCALVAGTARQPEVLRALRYTPNTSLYRLAGRLRYLEMRQGARKRSYHLVAVEPSPYLEATLERARGGAMLAELASALVSPDADISLEEAQGYVEALVEAQLLVPTWAPPLTGPEVVPHLIEQAQDVPALTPVRERLAEVHEALGRLDRGPPGAAPETYRGLARALEALPAPVELPHLFQVDAFRPAPEAMLSRRVLDEVQQAVRILQRLTPRAQSEHPLERFRERFLQRYEGRAVPLTEALDEDDGIGLAPTNVQTTRTGPLLEGFILPPQPAEERYRWSGATRHLLRRLTEVYRSEAQELVLSEEDIQALEVRDPSPLPDAFGVVGTLVADSAASIDRGDFRFLLENVHGPSGAMYLGRFCHGDPALESFVREYLAAEEALRPEALFAEIVHLPEGRMGNVICRPLLRRHDLPFLGHSGAADAEQIALTDLWVSVEGSRVVLRSKRLGREVIPRLTNAHNFTHYGLSLYRFLGMMQHQHRMGLAFQWGPFASSPFLPRVVHGRTVLAPAHWRLEAATLAEWGKARDAQRFAAVQRFRQQQRLPRWVCLRDGDNHLAVDLDNILSVETLVHLIKDRSQATLEELLPGPGQLCVESPEGHFVHEVVIPFLHQAPEPELERPVTAAAPLARTRPWRFPPGSEWLYAKLYAGVPTLDRLLQTVLADAIDRIAASGAASRWFFLRYNDPDPHVRLRFHGEPRRLETEVWPLLRDACAASLEAGEGWRLQLDTYEREVERYGGPTGVELSEELFAADSEAVLHLLGAYTGDEGLEMRWRLTLKGLDALLEALGLSLDEKAAVAQRMRTSFGAEFRVNKPFEEQLSLRYRRESKSLEALLRASERAESPWQPGLVALHRRDERLRPVAEQLRQAAQAGKLTVPVNQLADSFLHMHVNRMLPSDQRAQELILYDFLTRLYRSQQARMKQRT